MFERYVETARRVIFVARAEASQLGHSKIDVEHLLLGILSEDKPLQAHLRLPNEDSVRRRMEERWAAQPTFDDARDLQLSVAAKQALQRAAEEATRLGHQHIAPIHLLMGLLQDEESLAAELLKGHGVSLAQVEELSRLQSANGVLPPPPTAEPGMMQIITGFWVSRCVYTAAKLGLADLLADGAPKTAAELAAATGSHPDSLYRMLRALASVGVFEELPGQRFATTPLSRTLEDRHGSLRYFAMTELGQEHFAAWEEFPYSIRTGNQAFTEKFKQPVWEYYAANPEHATVFNRAMSTLTEQVTQAIFDVYDFSRFRKIVDLGGGQGTFLAAMLGRAPEARGVLFDAPPVIAAASRLSEVEDRAEKVAGNFFEAVPAGADLYTMKMILHDWNDEECHTILTNIRKVIAPGGRVAVFEVVLGGGGPAEVYRNFIDLNMMVMTGGRERTGEQYKALFERAGFEFTGVIATESPMGIVEGVAR